jgi:hypothetical protein
MSQAYFTPEDFKSAPDIHAQTTLLSDKFSELHRILYRRMRDLTWNLYPIWDKSPVIPGRSAAASGPVGGLSLPYLRSREQAVMVERLMGRDGADAPLKLELNRHPVIEMRLTEQHFAVELIVSPSSWLDQRNLVGKLSVMRHRQTLRQLLTRFDGDYLIGFWSGVHLSDAHVELRQLLRGRFLDEWMSTFCDGQDWMRVGMWYSPEDPVLATNALVPELMKRISALYHLYSFVVWTSNNNYQHFTPVATSDRTRASYVRH